MRTASLSLVRKSISIGVCVALTSLSAGPEAWASVVRVGVNSGPVTPMAAVGAAGAASMGVGLGAFGSRLSAPRLTGALPSMSMGLSPVAGVVSGTELAAPSGRTLVPSAAVGPVVRGRVRVPSVAPSGRAALSRKVARLSGRLAPELESAGRVRTAGAESARGVGRRIADILFGRKSASYGRVPVPAHGAYKSLGRNGALSSRSGRDALAKPERIYKRAFEEARKWAEAVGKGKAVVYFGEATASMPVRDGEHWKFTFYLSDEAQPTTADAVTVEFSRQVASNSGPFETRLNVYHDVAVPADQPVARIVPFRFTRFVNVSPEAALARARTGARYLSGRVSVSLRLEVEGEEGMRGDLWYHFFDDGGSEVAVNARTAAVRELRRSEPKTREERKEAFQLWKKMKELDSWLGANIPLYDVAKWIALIGVGLWLLDMAFGFADLLPRLGAGLLALAGVSAARGSDLGRKLRELDAWLDRNIPFYGIAKWIVLFSIGLWLLNAALGLLDSLPGLIGAVLAGL